MLLVGSVASFAVPGLIGIVVDAMTKNEWDTITYWCLVMTVIVVVSGIASGVRGYLFNLTSYGIARDIRYDMFHSLVRKDVGYFDTVKTGEILSRMSSDTQVVQDGLSTNISMFIRAVIFIVISLVILGFISWELTCITVGGIIPFVLFAICLGAILKKI